MTQCAPATEGRERCPEGRANNDEIAFQANTGYLWTWTPSGGGHDTGLKMAAGTSPSIDSYGDIAFQGPHGNLWVTGPGGTYNLGLGMAKGTSPSIQP